MVSIRRDQRTRQSTFVHAVNVPASEANWRSCFLSRLKRGKVSQVPAAAENTTGVLVVTRRWRIKRAPIRAPEEA
jgi:hypothetical protein